MANVISTLGVQPVFFFHGSHGCEDTYLSEIGKVGRVGIDARIRYRYRVSHGFWTSEQALQLNIHCHGVHLEEAGPHFDASFKSVASTRAQN